jgi:hypothetical protein
MLNQDIVREATRLTRAGQLVQATELLQRMLRGETAPEATSGARAGIALTGPKPLIIDAKADTIEGTVRTLRGPHPLNRACSGRCTIQRGAQGSDCGV